MEAINITFLGTGGVVPTKLRSPTAIFIQVHGEGILIDCGEGTQRQFLHAGISHNKITHIFLTHWHGDHVLGLPGLLQTLALKGYQKVLHIHGPTGTKKAMQELMPFLGANISALKIKIHEPQVGIIFQTDNFRIEAKEMSHGIPCLGYSIITKDKRKISKAAIKKYKLPNSPLLRELQQGKDIIWQNKKILAKKVTFVEEGKKVTVILDTHVCPAASELAKDSDLLVIESTFIEKEREKADERMHLTAKDAATIAKKAKVKQLALVHVSQRYDHNTKIIEVEAKRTFKNVVVPKDLDVIEV